MRFWRETALVLEAALAFVLVERVWGKLLPDVHWFVPFVITFVIVRVVLEVVYETFAHTGPPAKTPAPEQPIPSKLKDISGLPTYVDDLRELTLDEALKELERRLQKEPASSCLYFMYASLVNRVRSEIGRKKDAGADAD